MPTFWNNQGQTWTASRGQLGRSSGAKTTKNRKMLRDELTDGPTDMARSTTLKNGQESVCDINDLVN